MTTPPIIPDGPAHRASGPTTDPGAPGGAPLGRRARRAWLVVGAVLAVLGLALAALQTVGRLAHEERDERFTVADPAVAVLEVRSDAGPVEVVGAATDRVRVDAHVSTGLVATRFTHRVVGDRLVVRVTCRAQIVSAFCRADLRIVVPESFGVTVHSRDGDLVLSRLRGRVDASSDNGDLDADSLAGTTRLGSNNGSIRAAGLRARSVEADSDNGSVRLGFADAPASVVARSDNGAVEVALPPGEVRYAVDARSDNGRVQTLVPTDPASTRRVTATSANGDVTVHPTQ